MLLTGGKRPPERFICEAGVLGKPLLPAARANFDVGSINSVVVNKWGYSANHNLLSQKLKPSQESGEVTFDFVGVSTVSREKLELSYKEPKHTILPIYQERY
jgi:hypothetical protein